MPPTISLIVPTRGRPALLRRMLDSTARTACHPERLEVVLVTDADDPDSRLSHPTLAVRHVILPPGQTMGELNNAGFEASTGTHVMLLNDDVIVRTPGWDVTALAAFARFPDPFVLVHVNDTLMGDHLCTFPLTTRAFYDQTDGVCPRAYQRYRIDDHIEDVFNLLRVLGESRVVYLPDVVFEHDNAVDLPEAGRPVYLSDPAVLARDAPRFTDFFSLRKDHALRVWEAITGPDADALGAARARLDAVPDSFALRVPGRQLVVRSPWWKPVAERASDALAAAKRALGKDRRGLVRAVRKRLRGLGSGSIPARTPLPRGEGLQSSGF